MNLSNLFDKRSLPEMSRKIEGCIDRHRYVYLDRVKGRQTAKERDTDR